MAKNCLERRKHLWWRGYRRRRDLESGRQEANFQNDEGSLVDCFSPFSETRSTYMMMGWWYWRKWLHVHRKERMVRSMNVMESKLAFNMCEVDSRSSNRFYLVCKERLARWLLNMKKIEISQRRIMIKIVNKQSWGQETIWMNRQFIPRSRCTKDEPGR